MEREKSSHQKALACKGTLKTPQLQPPPSLPSSHPRLFLNGLIWALGMKFAIEEINNSTTLLPGVRLGYDMYNTCFEPLMALQPSLLFLTRRGTRAIGVHCNYTDYQPRVTAVIGPHRSDLCLATAKLFSFFLVPQVSSLQRAPSGGVCITNAVYALGP